VCRGPGRHEDSRADHRTDSQGRQGDRSEHALETVVSRHFFQQEFQRFSREELFHPSITPIQGQAGLPPDVVPGTNFLRRAAPGLKVL
jgi:hypothetical protein